MLHFGWFCPSQRLLSFNVCITSETNSIGSISLIFLLGKLRLEEVKCQVPSYVVHWDSQGHSLPSDFPSGLLQPPDRAVG